MAGPVEDGWAHVPSELRGRYDIEFGSIPNVVRVNARRYPTLEAVVDDDVRLTFMELETAMVDAIRGMIAAGVRPGTRVGLLAPNSARWIVAALGILGAGGVLVPLNTRFKGPEAAYILRKSGAHMLLTVTDFLDNDYPGMLRAADPELAALNRVVVISGHTDAMDWRGFLDGGRQIDAEIGHGAIDALTPDSLSDIMFTSGTTGYPKGVMMSHGQSLRAHGWLTKVMGFRAGDPTSSSRRSFTPSATRPGGWAVWCTARRAFRNVSSPLIS
jgi:long-subunit acyl-CoA synthetase (AMP-forming)